ncbi:MAG: hypothetical protein JRI23_25925 [Deltaproteobacteria bacterium]|jgi:hypothetical protein|nr:hypothetical protein [Deltaproteobacteria bacterium]MBW2535467.1 hypothetical protein [Deltaproteobacteria bacterium]
MPSPTTKLLPAVRRAITSTFGRERAAAARRLVQALTVEVPDDILCSIVEASKGQLALLRSDLRTAQIDWRDAVMAGMTRALRRLVADELRAAGLPIGRARGAVIEALTAMPGMPVERSDIRRWIRGRATDATFDEVAALLVAKRWLRVDERGRYTFSAHRRRR